jgi:hypothetical protein
VEAGAPEVRGVIERGGGVARVNGATTLDGDERGGAAPAATVVSVVTGAVETRLGRSVVVGPTADATARAFAGAAPAAKVPTSPTVAVTLTITVATRLRRAG